MLPCACRGMACTARVLRSGRWGRGPCRSGRVVRSGSGQPRLRVLGDTERRMDRVQAQPHGRRCALHCGMGCHLAGVLGRPWLCILGNVPCLGAAQGSQVVSRRASPCPHLVYPRSHTASRPADQLLVRGSHARTGSVWSGSITLNLGLEISHLVHPDYTGVIYFRNGHATRVQHPSGQACSRAWQHHARTT